MMLIMLFFINDILVFFFSSCEYIVLICSFDVGGGGGIIRLWGRVFVVNKCFILNVILFLFFGVLMLFLYDELVFYLGEVNDLYFFSIIEILEISIGLFFYVLEKDFIFLKRFLCMYVGRLFILFIN